MTSEITVRARAFVAERLPQARGLGQILAELIDDPEAFTTTLTEGLRGLADPEYAAEQERVAPGGGLVIGVRWPLVRAVARQLRRPLRDASSASALWLGQRLAMAPEREVRLFSHVPLERSLRDDPERSWQLIRRLAREACDWISVDTLAQLVAQGIVREPYRWAELEQLVYSTLPGERRLVGSAIARMPFAVPAAHRRQLDADRGLSALRSLIGDADPLVQKALGWALREWTRVDAAGVRELLESEAQRARATDDGHRAWVIRDALPAQPAPVSLRVRQLLAPVRRRADAPSTSEAAAVAQRYGEIAALADRTVHAQGERMAGGRP